MGICFIVFLFLYIRKHYDTDLSDQSKPDSRINCDELFKELKRGVGRIENLMLVGRKFIFALIVFCPKLPQSAIFISLCVLQAAYCVQTVIFKKYESIFMSIVNIINELLLLAFIIIFAIVNTIEEWRNNGSKGIRSIVIYLIMINTLIVVAFQLS